MDKEAKKILFRTYWKNGWIAAKDRYTESNDFLYAKEKGMMFDPLSITHDECISEIISLRDSISKRLVIKAFLSSLSTRRLDWRSGIASWFIAQQMKIHTYTPLESGHFYENGTITKITYTCEICKNSMYGIRGAESYTNSDLNVLNFERIKWGGVRHGDVLYTMFDLRQFKNEEIPDPTLEDISLFKAILEIIETSLPNDYPSALRRRLSTIKELRATKNEIDTLMEVLACIQVLQPTTYERPSRGKHDWLYVEYWRGEDKYNKDTVQQLFGEYF